MSWKEMKRQWVQEYASIYLKNAIHDNNKNEKQLLPKNTKFYELQNAPKNCEEHMTMLLWTAITMTTFKKLQMVRNNENEE